LGGMIVASVQREQLFSRDRVADIKLMRTHDIAFRPNAKQLGFDGIEIEFRRDRLSENLIEGSDESFPRRFAVRRRVFVPVWNPYISDALFPECLAHCRPNFTAGYPVFDPELTNRFVVVRQSEAVGSFWMRKECGIKIQPDSAFTGPGNPVGEMSG